MDLKPNQEFLFTRQRHEADRMGLHWDYRLVVGDLAYSFATKKELPEPGKAITLFEQPVHDRAYALSPKVVIPPGQYGAGITYLDWIRKAHIGERSTPQQLTIYTKNGDKFLLKKMKDDNKWGNKAWLFKNLGKKDPENQYLDKQASLLGGALATHLIQNIGTNAALKSKHVAQYLANGFAQGTKGLVDGSVKAKLTRMALGAGLPDIAVAHKTMHDLGGSMKGILDKATSKQKAGIRMMTEGRIDDLKKYNLHNDPVIREAHRQISKHVSIPSIDEIVGSAKSVGKVWKDKSHPLLSNIIANSSRGKVNTSSKMVPGKLSAKPILGGAIGSFAVDPAAGTLNTAKGLMASEKFNANKYGKKVTDMLHKQFVTNPIKKGVEKPGLIGGLKNKMYGLTVNPLSAQLKRTSSSLTDAL